MELEKQELLSVIVPIYNVEAYLSRCLDSIINQTYRDLEIICVDDGSTDQSGAMADEYAKKDRRIKVIHKGNGGIVSARKAGIKIATGQYISNIDSDDYIELDMYETLMREIVDNNADVITSGLIRDYGNHVVYEDENVEPGLYEEKNLKKKVLFRMIDTDCFYKPNISMHITNKIFKASELKEYQLSVDDCINIGEDTAVVLPYFMNIEKAIISGRNFYHYCIRNDSVMGVKNQDDLIQLDSLFTYLAREIEKIEYDNNYRIQIKFLKTYLYLLRDATQILRIDENGLFPFGNIDKSNSIMLYGAGKFGVELKRYLESNGFHIVAWVDRSKNREEIITINEIQHYDFDAVVIGILGANTIYQITEELVNRGIERSKIYFIDKAMLENNTENKDM